MGKNINDGLEKLKFNVEEKKLLESFGIEAVILFGSHARGSAGPLSDFDFGVLLATPIFQLGMRERKKIYDALYDLLSSKIKQLIDIDIVFLNIAPMELQSHAAKYGVPVYEKNIHSFSRFRERVMDLYSDFAPLRSIFHEAIIDRIS